MLLYIYDFRDTTTYVHVDIPLSSRVALIGSFHATIYLWVQGHHYIYTWFQGHQTNINLLCLLRFRSKQLDWCTKCTQLVYTPVLQEQSIHANVDQFLCIIVLTNLLDSILSCFLSSTYGVNGTRWLDVRSPFVRMTLPFHSLKGISSLSLRQQSFEINAYEHCFFPK